MFQGNETKNRVYQWRLETCYYHVRRSHALSYNVDPCNRAWHTWNTLVHTFQMSSWKHDEACDFTWRDTNVFLSRRSPPMQQRNAWPASDQHRTSIDIFASVDHLAAQHRHNEVPLSTRRQHMTPYSQLSSILQICRNLLLQEWQ